jgi:hypothetical protein
MPPVLDVNGAAPVANDEDGAGPPSIRPFWEQNSEAEPNGGNRAGVGAATGADAEEEAASLISEGDDCCCCCSSPTLCSA